MALTISGYGWAKRHKRRFPAVITVEDPDKRNGLRFHRTPAPNHLILRFDDLDYPPPDAFAHRVTMASVTHIEDALAFGRLNDEMLIHCQVGIARSTGVALGILMDRLKDEGAAYAELARIRPEAVPNQHVVSLVDQILGSQLRSRLDAWDARNRWNSVRRKLCRRAYFFHCGIPLEPDLVKLNQFDLAGIQQD